MEIAAEYDRPLRGAAVADLRRSGRRACARSGRVSPSPVGDAESLAPISHHWLDATHITFGVVTGGYTRSDGKQRPQCSMAVSRMRSAPISIGGDGFVFRPPVVHADPAVALQVSAGLVCEAEAAHDSGRGWTSIASRRLRPTTGLSGDESRGRRPSPGGGMRRTPRRPMPFSWRPT